jgi:hypothetical protein
MSSNKVLTCTCHYKSQTYYGQINELSNHNISRINEARKKREEIGGTHLHIEQIQQLPGHFDKEVHGIHSTPCYKL